MRGVFLLIKIMLLLMLLLPLASCNNAQAVPSVPPGQEEPAPPVEEEPDPSPETPDPIEPPLDPTLPEVPPEPEVPDPIEPVESGPSYFVDCDNGNNNNSGKSEVEAWRSLSQVGNVKLVAGHTVRLKRGCRFNESLDLNLEGSREKPVTFTSFGEGEKPILTRIGSKGAVISITGRFVIFDNLQVTSAPPTNSRPNCPTGWHIGFYLINAQHVTVQHSKASGLTSGVVIDDNSSQNTILHNELVNNNVLSVNTQGGDDDSGAWGVLINGNNNQIAYNYFTGNTSYCSFDYEQDGASVEIYRGSENTIHHNISVDDVTFSELGTNIGSARANTFAYNLFVNTKDEEARFIILRGSGYLGPTPETKVINNTVYLSGARSIAIACLYCSRDVLTLKNNILWSEWQPLYADNIFVESNNIYWNSQGKPLINLQGNKISDSSMIRSPQFTSLENFDFSLGLQSPAIDEGAIDLAHLDFLLDLSGEKSQVGAGVDIGAYEFQAVLSQE